MEIALRAPMLQNRYDLKYTGPVLSTSDTIMHDSYVMSLMIEVIDDIDYSSFDVFIFGHFIELESLVGGELRKQLLDNLKKIRKKYFLLMILDN